MRLLCFQARSFGWKSFQRTVDEIDGESVADVELVDELGGCVVVFAHVESRDEGLERRASVLRQTVKHVKWLANKRDLKAAVLHSFTHLGAENASPGFARDLLREVAERLSATGYEVRSTPFGYLCEWQLDVFGESLAKVYKEI